MTTKTVPAYIGEVVDLLTNHEGGGRLQPYRVPTATTHPYKEQLLTRLIELGWEPEFVRTHFERLHDNILNNWPLTIFIPRYFKALIRHQSYTSLHEIGLRPDVASAAHKAIELLTSYTEFQKLDIGIEYVLGDYIPITPASAKYLYEPTVQDTWITHEKLRMYNLSSSCLSSRVLPQLIAAVNSMRKQKSSHTYYYHTTNWRSVRSITTRGVNRQRGRTCLDFGIFPGFYMSDTIYRALEWGSIHNDTWSNEVAILIFSIPNVLPKRIKYKELYGDEWTAVTQESRRCKQEEDEVELLLGYDMVYGDMVSNPNDVFHGRASPTTHTPPKKQLVSKTDKGDDYMTSHLVGVVYFRK